MAEMETAVFCTYCGERFSRSKHLDRHILIHTNVKPFKCEICHVSFNRQDLYKRHMRLVHTEVQDVETTNRTPIACTNCAKAKTKCDREVPCSRCRDKKIECQPRSSRRSAEATHREAKRRLEQERLHKNARNKSPKMQEPETSASPPVSPSSRTSTKGSSSTAEGLPDGHVLFQNSQPTFDTSPTFSLPLKDVPVSFATEELPAPPFNTPTIESCDFTYGAQFGPNLFSDHPYTTVVPNPSHQFHFSTSTTLTSPLNEMEPGFGTMFDFHPDQLNFADFMDGVEPSFPLKTSEMTSPGSATSAMQEMSTITTPIHAHPAAHEDWPAFACNPTSVELSSWKNTRWYLDTLKTALKNGGSWGNAPLTNPATFDNASSNETIFGELINNSTRDKLLVVTQGLIQKATAHTRHALSNSTYPVTSAQDIDHESFVPIPPAEVLDRYLRVYWSRFEPYYGFATTVDLHPSRMLDASAGKSSSLLLLSMVAHGALAGSYADWCLSSTLTEACHFSFRELMTGEDSQRLRDTEALRVALSMLCLTAWSGDAWHMNTSLQQWAMSLSRLKTSGLLGQQNLDYQYLTKCTDHDEILSLWKEQESRSRLINAWVSVDLELSIFFDAPPKLSVKDLDIALPTDIRWRNVQSIEDILASYKSLISNFGAEGNDTTIPSCSHLFQKFLERDISDREIRLTPQQLQLLLHGLQCLAMHLYECLGSFFDLGPRFYLDSLTTTFGTRALLQDLESLLRQWYSIYQYSAEAFSDEDYLPSRTLLLYHLMSARVLLSFQHLESLASGEPAKNFFGRIPHVRGRLVEESPNIYFHCGQVFKLVRELPRDNLPLWWPAAIYRVTILLWSVSWAHVQNGPSTSGDVGSRDYSKSATVPIDSLTSDNDKILRCLRTRDGVPVLTTKTGQSVPLEVPDNILAFSLEFLDEQGDGTRLAEGIKSRLGRLRERWAQLR